MTCRRCGVTLSGRLNTRRQWCGGKCRSAANHAKQKQTCVRVIVPGVVPAQETKRERYLRQCAETAWM